MRIYKKRIERITIIGDRPSDEAIKYCFDHGYDIKGLAPKFIKKYTIDKNKFKLVAEREINENAPELTPERFQKEEKVK